MTTLVAAEPMATWKVVAQLVAMPVLLVYCMARKRNDLRIVVLCVVSLTLYGLIQDQFSVRLAPEYFTVAHQPIEGVSNPTLLGLLWGFMGSWWGGLLMGMAAGLTATLGKRPQLTARELAPGVGCVLLGVAFVTLACGGSAYYVGSVMGARLLAADALSARGQLLFLTVACAHVGTYASAAAGSVALCVWVAWCRRAKAVSAAGGPATS
jgi:hypothetical protein